MHLILVVVNNAGFVLGIDKIGDINDAEYESMFQVNVFGLIAMTQLLVKGTLLCLPLS
jgi:3-hydroxy acid dehydrogenase / malonic semialdehyde reductase